MRLSCIVLKRCWNFCTHQKLHREYYLSAIDKLEEGEQILYTSTNNISLY